MSTNEGAWKKTNKMKDRRSYATAHPLSKKKRSKDHLAKVPLAKPKAFIEEAETLGDDASFDPVQRDPFFAVLSVSQYWPPSADTIERLRHSTSAMSMFDREAGDAAAAKKKKKEREEGCGSNGNAPPGKKLKQSTGIPKAPPGMDISSRRKTLTDTSDEEEGN